MTNLWIKFLDVDLITSNNSKLFFFRGRLPLDPDGS